MIRDIESFRSLKEKHAKEILNFLLNEKESFDILCVLEDITFNPTLPEHISNNFSEIILFSLANYTLESAYVEGDNLIFEAGFGEENFGSVVSVPIYTILQITKEEIPLFINFTAQIPKPKKPKNPFKLNPRNKKFMN